MFIQNNESNTKYIIIRECYRLDYLDALMKDEGNISSPTVRYKA